MVAADVVTVELLYVDGCPTYPALLKQLQQLMRSAKLSPRLELRRISDDRAARRERFLGSPTVRVNGRDVEPGADKRDDFGVKCRLYRLPSGLRRAPLDEWMMSALSSSG
jgi:hypothetical protein